MQLRDYFVHPSSFVEDTAIGTGTKVWHFCHLHGAKIGQNCSIGQGCYIAPGVIIGDNVHVQNGVSLYTGVVLEDDVFVGPHAIFTNVLNPRAFISRKNEYRKTLVKRGASIGAGAIIVCGVTIGEYAAIGAGAVVTEDIMPFTLCVGVPAKIKRKIDREFRL